MAITYPSRSVAKKHVTLPPKRSSKKLLNKFGDGVPLGAAYLRGLDLLQISKGPCTSWEGVLKMDSSCCRVVVKVKLKGNHTFWGTTILTSRALHTCSDSTSAPLTSGTLGPPTRMCSPHLAWTRRLQVPADGCFGPMRKSEARIQPLVDS